MLLLLKWSTISSVSRQISYGLYELLKTGAANIHSEADWAVTFTLLEVIGAGAPLPKLADGTFTSGAASSGEKFFKLTYLGWKNLYVGTFCLMSIGL